MRWFRLELQNLRSFQCHCTFSPPNLLTTQHNLFPDRCIFKIIIQKHVKFTLKNNFYTTTRCKWIRFHS